MRLADHSLTVVQKHIADVSLSVREIFDRSSVVTGLTIKPIFKTVFALYITDWKLI